jgi:ComF family protein
MTTFFILYKIVLDALFPLSQTEEGVFSMSPEEALNTLLSAPGYNGLAVALPHAQSIFAYKDERVAKLVWNIKYKKSIVAVRIGGYALLEALSKRPENTLPSPTVVVIPMPITEKRRRERGYNQCELLIDEIGRLEQEAGKHRFIIKKDLLVRTQHASRQTLKGREDRVESAKGIFGINKEALEVLTEQDPEFKQKTIIVVDDVITTGSTMYEAIQTLKSTGFVDIRALSLAH